MTMNTIIEELLGHPGDGPRASLYLPTVEAGPEIRQNPIRLKNRLREARTGLQTAGTEASVIDALLAPAQARLDDATFWQHQRRGLAIFLAPGFDREVPLSRDPGELTFVGSRFHLKPLFVGRMESLTFNLLALSQNRVRLFTGTTEHLEPLPVEALPESLEDALGTELTEQHLDHHSSDAHGRAIHHAQGRGKDDEDAELAKFCRLVDEAVVNTVDRTTPLVLAGVDNLLSVYRSVSHHPTIVDETVSGNPDRLDGSELLQRTHACVAPELDARRDHAIERFESARVDDAVVVDLPDIVIAAMDGRVGTLLFAEDDECVWGVVDPERRRITCASDGPPSGEDLIDRAVVEAFATGADLVPLQRDRMPRDAHVLAITRY